MDCGLGPMALSRVVSAAMLGSYGADRSLTGGPGLRR